MKKKLKGILLAASLAFTSLVPAVAGALPPQTDVTGVITENSTAVAGASVTVTCGTTVKTDTTDSFGSYLVTFATVECPFGSTVKVVAKKDDKSGTNSGTVRGITTKLNIAIVNVDIPEYGLIGGAIATATGLGAIALARRRFAEQGTGL